ncbi:MAG: site-2 protease family protein [Lentisphaerae bacterium]|nr:site-2 protease family protein [Lentisphaerota bacterium]
MFGSSYRIATVWGIPIKIHMSLILLLLFFALTMGVSGGPGAILVLLVIEFGVFASIALHELGHSFVALRKGTRVREITLMFIGGAAQMEDIPARPRDEFQLAIAGPAVSVVLGLLLWFGGGALPLARADWPVPIVRAGPVQANIVQFIGLINLGLALFNLLPSFPMDGGRLFRALLAHRMGRLRATYIAARVGKVMAVIFGLYGFFSAPTRWLLVAIAFFIYIAAGNEYRMVRMQEAARRARGGFHGMFGGYGDEDGGGDDGGRVSVSPPPYERGRGSHVDLYTER